MPCFGLPPCHQGYSSERFISMQGRHRLKITFLNLLLAVISRVLHTLLQKFEHLRSTNIRGFSFMLLSVLLLYHIFGFHLKNGVSLVETSDKLKGTSWTLDFYTRVRFALADMVWVHLCHYTVGSLKVITVLLWVITVLSWWELTFPT